MEDNQSYQSDHDTHNDCDDFYDPYQEYVKQKTQESMQGEPGLDPSRYPSSDIPKTKQSVSRAIDYRSTKRKPTNLEVAGFVLSLASMLCCCCSNIYVSLGAAIMSIAVCICSRFFYNETGRFHPIVLIGLILSVLSIILVLFLVYFYLQIYPQLLEDPQFRQLLEQMQALSSGSAGQTT